MSLEIERAAATVWIRVQMARHGLTLTDLQAAGCFAEKAPRAAPAHLPQRRRAEMGRAGRDAGLVAAGRQCGADGGAFQGGLKLRDRPGQVGAMEQSRPHGCAREAGGHHAVPADPAPLPGVRPRAGPRGSARGRAPACRSRL